MKKIRVKKEFINEANNNGSSNSGNTTDPSTNNAVDTSTKQLQQNNTTDPSTNNTTDSSTNNAVDSSTNNTTDSSTNNKPVPKKELVLPAPSLVIEYNKTDKSPDYSKTITIKPEEIKVEEIIQQTSTPVIKVKMSEDFMNRIKFPKAALLLESLMKATHMPDKFKNVFNSFDDSPLKTISACEDLASKYFGNVSKDFTVKESKSEIYYGDGLIPLNEANLGGILAGMGLGAYGAGYAAGSTKFSHITNDSHLNKNFNEFVKNPEAAQKKLFAAIDSYISNLLPIIELALINITSPNKQSDISKFTESVNNALSHRTVDIVEMFIDNNNELLANRKVKLLEDINKKLNVIKQRQDELRKLLNKKEDPVKIGNDEKVSKNDIEKYFAGTLPISDASKILDNYLADSVPNMDLYNEAVSTLFANKLFEVYSPIFEDDNKATWGNNNISYSYSTSSPLDNTSSITYNIKNTDNSTSTLDASTGKLDDNKEQEVNEPEISDNIKGSGKLDDIKGEPGKDAGDNVGPVVHADTNIKTEGNTPIFDADQYFNEYQSIFRKAMATVLTGDWSDWELVKTSKVAMEGLRDAATKEIEGSIELVCRTGNGEKSGLTGKLAAFISKHPMRATKLTALWKRHEADLNMRILARIRQIGETSGKGPLLMAKQLYRDVIPTLFAILVVYKVMYTLFTDERMGTSKKYTKKELEEIRTIIETITEPVIETYDLSSKYFNSLTRLFIKYKNILGMGHLGIDGKLLNEKTIFSDPFAGVLLFVIIKKNISNINVNKVMGIISGYHANPSALFSSICDILKENNILGSDNKIVDWFKNIKNDALEQLKNYFMTLKKNNVLTGNVNSALIFLNINKIDFNELVNIVYN